MLIQVLMKNKATKDETLHNITSYNKLLIVCINVESESILQTPSGSVFHKLITEGKRSFETKFCGQSFEKVRLSLLI